MYKIEEEKRLFCFLRVLGYLKNPKARGNIYWEKCSVLFSFKGSLRICVSTVSRLVSAESHVHTKTNIHRVCLCVCGMYIYTHADTHRHVYVVHIVVEKEGPGSSPLATNSKHFQVPLGLRWTSAIKHPGRIPQRPSASPSALSASEVPAGRGAEGIIQLHA